MKKALILSAAVLALAACSNEDFINNEVAKQEKGEMISFGSFTKGTSRADHTGADAATLLGKNFVVEGTKGETSVATGVVFDNYNVNWNQNTAETTQSNTSDWEYVGVAKNANSQIDETVGQTIKYWDYSQKQYDFIAYSLGQSTEATVTPITPETATKAEEGGAYKITGKASDLAKCYIADLVTVKDADFGKEVQLTFRNLSSKIRLAFYETVPGYSIKDLTFSPNATDEFFAEETKLFSAEKSIYGEGTYVVYYPTVNTPTSSNNNQAHVVFTPTSTGSSSIIDLTPVEYTRPQESTKQEGVLYLGVTSNDPSYNAGGYVNVLPNETASALTLRCNYTLVSNDGSGEEIKVLGATAVVPAQFCQWKSNYAYTYIFKISDATNGSTQKLGGVEGLRPITFDAVVMDSQDGIQETITTVATPSITTYGYDEASKAVVKSTEKNEYPEACNVYVMVQKGEEAYKDLNEKGTLYTVTTENTIETEITEAEVMDALNMGKVEDKTVTGRNFIKMVEAEEGIVEFPVEVPGADGNMFTVEDNSTAMFKTKAETTYAYVYKVSEGTPTTYNTAVALTTKPTDWNKENNVYYKDFACTTPANIDFVAGTYYQKLTNNNTVYAVKVIRVN